MTRASQPAISAHTYSSWVQSVGAPVSKAVSYLVAPSAEALLQLPSFFAAVCAEKQVKLITLSLREKSVREIKEILESSFLGQSNWYGIWDLESVGKNILPTLIDYFAQYQGPHILIICYSAEFTVPVKLKKDALTLPSTMSPQQAADFCAPLPARLCNRQTVQLLMQGVNQLSLAQLLIALFYLPLLGRTLLVPFKEEYLPRLAKPDAGSFFTFTDLFWQRNGSAFYAQWARMRELYGPQFWLSFWSDQLFRAHCYATAMHAQQIAMAQQIAARKLSFFYIKTGWQKAPPTLLVQLHDMIYQIDHTSKSGGTTDMLECVYQRWFTHSR